MLPGGDDLVADGGDARAEGGQRAERTAVGAPLASAVGVQPLHAGHAVVRTPGAAVAHVLPDERRLAESIDGEAELDRGDRGVRDRYAVCGPRRPAGGIDALCPEAGASALRPRDHDAARRL